MPRKARWSFVGVVALMGWALLDGELRAQQPPPQPPAVGQPGAATNEELLRQIQELQKQVKQVGELKDQVKSLQDQLKDMQKQKEEKDKEEAKKKAEEAPKPKLYPGGDDGSKLLGNDPRRGSALASGYGAGGAGPQADFNPKGSWSGGPSSDNFPLKASYTYNKGGGAFLLSDPDKEFTLFLQNQITFDGTFYDRQFLPTNEKGFNVPFQRTYLYGNITRYWEYQVSEEAFLGQFNLLDMFINVHYDDRMMFRFGKFLSPFLLEYWAHSPAWEPVITNSPLFQFAGRRQVGAMVWGKLLDYKVQYQAGIFNGPNGFYFDLDRNSDFMGAITVTPFKGDGTPWLDSLGFGVSVQTGWENLLLSSGKLNPGLNTGNGAGEPTPGNVLVTSSGVPFFTYNDNVRALGNRTKIAPHFFWLGRFSVQGEYLIQSQQLADANNSGRSVYRAYYVNASYFLTGERYSGDGTGTYTPISPIRPFMPSRGQWGPGAYELAAQFSEVNAGNGDIARGFANPVTNATRLDQLMIGINWWPNKWARVSFDWVYDKFNRSISLSSPISIEAPGHPINRYDTFWTRVAFFF
jgi:phosphate-selective porin OprO and OprP